MREAAGLTQKAAAVRIGMGQSTLAEIETGKRSPTLEEAYAFLDLYGGKIEDLDVRGLDPARARVKRQRGRPRIPTEFYYDGRTSAERLYADARTDIDESVRYDAIGQPRRAYEAAARAVSVTVRWRGVLLHRRAPRPNEGLLDYARSTGIVVDLDELRIAEGLLDPTFSDDRGATRLLLAIATGLLAN